MDEIEEYFSCEESEGDCESEGSDDSQGEDENCIDGKAGHAGIEVNVILMDLVDNVVKSGPTVS